MSARPATRDEGADRAKGDTRRARQVLRGRVRYISGSDAADGALKSVEIRDYLALGISALALMASVRALIVSERAFRLARDRDRRERDLKLPLIGISAPDCDGLGPWTFGMTIKNRDDTAIMIERVTSDTKRVVEMIDSEAGPVSLARINDASALNFARLNLRLEPGEIAAITLQVIAFGGKRVPSRAEAEFEVTYRSEGGSSDSLRSSSRIVLNP